MKILPSFFSLDFFILCFSSFLFFASFNMIIPELPSYLTSIGGGEYKGLIISLFTLTAGLSRPFSGKLADKVGRKPVMIFGAGICILVSLLYPVITSVAGFLFLRFVHGFSTGFTPTGISAYVADIGTTVAFRVIGDGCRTSIRRIYSKCMGPQSIILYIFLYRRSIGFGFDTVKRNSVGTGHPKTHSF
jgi:MFS family permease